MGLFLAHRGVVPWHLRHTAPIGAERTARLAVGVEEQTVESHVLALPAPLLLALATRWPARIALLQCPLKEIVRVFAQLAVEMISTHQEQQGRTR